MKWGLAFIAGLIRPTPYAAPAYLAGSNRTSAAISGSASTTSAKPLPDVTLQSMSRETMIHTRALRLHNRNPQGAEKYTRLHMILDRGN